MPSVIIAQTNDNEVEIHVVEKMPKFNRGKLVKFIYWVYDNINYPTTAINDTISGKVYAKFIVDSNGTVNNVQIIKGVRWDLDAEVKRVLMSSPTWIPGYHRGKNVDVPFIIPVEFNISDPYFTTMKRKLGW